jgi:hypothetical protein
LRSLYARNVFLQGYQRVIFISRVEKSKIRKKTGI